MVGVVSDFMVSTFSVLIFNYFLDIYEAGSVVFPAATQAK